jgi:hypothetical protein
MDITAKKRGVFRQARDFDDIQVYEDRTQADFELNLNL